jgi:hypothetical protein
MECGGVWDRVEGKTKRRQNLHLKLLSTLNNILLVASCHVHKRGEHVPTPNWCTCIDPMWIHIDFTKVENLLGVCSLNRGINCNL